MNNVNFYWATGNWKCRTCESRRVYIFVDNRSVQKRGDFLFCLRCGKSRKLDLPSLEVYKRDIERTYHRLPDVEMAANQKKETLEAWLQ